MSDTQGYPAWQDAFAANNHFNALAFMMRQMMAEASHVSLVTVKAVTANQTAGAPPLVNVQPLVAMVDQTGTAQAHGIIYNVPTFRAQSGKSAFICDPKVGDIGAVIVADRDISSAIANQGPANPGSFRRFDWADALYIGGFGSVDPTTFVKVDDVSGVTIQVAGGNPLTINADSITMRAANGSGATTITVTGGGTTTQDIVVNGVSVDSHLHSDSTSGPDDTGPPV